MPTSKLFSDLAKQVSATRFCGAPSQASRRLSRKSARQI